MGIFLCVCYPTGFGSHLEFSTSANYCIFQILAQLQVKITSFIDSRKDFSLQTYGVNWCKLVFLWSKK